MASIWRWAQAFATEKTMRTISFMLFFWASSITYAAQVTYSFSGVLDRIQDDNGFVNTPPAKAGGFELRLKAGSIGPSAD